MKNKIYSKYDRPMGSTIDQSGQRSRTRQSEKDNCDINKIMERFNRTGQLPQMRTTPPQYGDARIVDYQTAQQIIKDAKSAFNELPAKVRQEFGHDPQNYLQALSDTSKDNVQKLLKLGILIEREEEPKEVLKRIASNTKKDAEKSSGNSTPT